MSKYISENYITSEVKAFSHSGAYIPMPLEWIGEKVIVSKMVNKSHFLDGSVKGQEIDCPANEGISDLSLDAVGKANAKKSSVATEDESRGRLTPCMTPINPHGDSTSVAISLCPHCHCMTDGITICGKCKKEKVRI